MKEVFEGRKCDREGERTNSVRHIRASSVRHIKHSKNESCKKYQYSKSGRVQFELSSIAGHEFSKNIISTVRADEFSTTYRVQQARVQ